MYLLNILYIITYYLSRRFSATQTIFTIFAYIAQNKKQTKRLPDGSLSDRR